MRTRCLAPAFFLIIISILIGIIGFRIFCRKGWYDSFCCSVSGLSYGGIEHPVDEPGRAFCCLFGLYGTIFFLVLAAILIGDIFGDVVPLT